MANLVGVCMVSQKAREIIEKIRKGLGNDPCSRHPQPFPLVSPLSQPVSLVSSSKECVTDWEPIQDELLANGPYQDQALEGTRLKPLILASGSDLSEKLPGNDH